MRNEWTRRMAVLLAAAAMALGAGCAHSANNPAPGTGGSGREPTPQTQPNTPTTDQPQHGGPPPNSQPSQYPDYPYHVPTDNQPRNPRH